MNAMTFISEPHEGHSSRVLPRTHRRRRLVAVAEGVAGRAQPDRRGGRTAYGHPLVARESPRAERASNAGRTSSEQSGQRTRAKPFS